jgi:hypothetical protein
LIDKKSANISFKEGYLREICVMSQAGARVRFDRANNFVPRKPHALAKSAGPLNKDTALSCGRRRVPLLRGPEKMLEVAIEREGWNLIGEVERLSFAVLSCLYIAVGVAS